jgi:hypothetical protein
MWEKARGRRSEIRSQRLLGCVVIFLTILSVDIFAVADLDHIDHQILVFDGVDNSVTSLSKTILVPAGQLFATRWSRVFRELANTFNDPPAILLQRDGLNVLDRRWFNQNFIYDYLLYSV